MRLGLLLLAVLASGCATTPRKGAGPCPESQEVCLNDRRCVYDTKRDCQVCACRAWDDSGPKTSGPAGQALPEGTPSRMPPREP
jgi:hypothetical protein